MTEQDYINTKALGTVTAGINALRDLCPANLKEVIHEGEYEQAMSMLCQWQDRLHEVVNITEPSS